jgi:hypothetical protein
LSPQDITFKDIIATGAARCGDIAGFKGDLLTGLTFDNVTFKTTPKKSWNCGYVGKTTRILHLHCIPCDSTTLSMPKR